MAEAERCCECPVSGRRRERRRCCRIDVRDRWRAVRQSRDASRDASCEARKSRFVRTALPLRRWRRICGGYPAMPPPAGAYATARGRERSGRLGCRGADSIDSMSGVISPPTWIPRRHTSAGAADGRMIVFLGGRCRRSLLPPNCSGGRCGCAFGRAARACSPPVRAGRDGRRRIVCGSARHGRQTRRDS